MHPRRRELLDAVMDAIPVWQVLVVQFNDAVAQRLGISASDMQCLFVLSRHGPSSPSAIAQHIGITTGSASRMVERLFAAGLVTREAHSRDRRRVVVDATPEALSRIATHYEPLLERLREHLGEMTEDALNQMLNFVKQAEQSTSMQMHESTTSLEDGT